MSATVMTAAIVALSAATAAALYDWRGGRIPNWLTIPPLVAAPIAYGLGVGLDHGLHSLGAAVLSGTVPYLLFRRGAMGGGDVKLFAALGAVMGFDLLAGIEIQLAAFAVAMLVAFGALAWKGILLATLANALAQALRPLLPSRWRVERSAALSVPVRMGGPIFVATLLLAAPHLLPGWSRL